MNNRIKILICLGVMLFTILSLPAQINKNLEAIIREYKKNEAVCKQRFSRYLINKFYSAYEDYPVDSINSMLTNIQFNFTPQFIVSDNDLKKAQSAEDILNALTFDPQKPFRHMDLEKDGNKSIGACAFTPLYYYNLSVYKVTDAASLQLDYDEYEKTFPDVMNYLKGDFLFAIVGESNLDFAPVAWILAGGKLLSYTANNGNIENGLIQLEEFLDKEKNKWEIELYAL